MYPPLIHLPKATSNVSSVSKLSSDNLKTAIHDAEATINTPVATISPNSPNDPSFSNLPPEICDKIWSIALVEPRVFRFSGGCSHQDYCYWSLKSPARAPHKHGNTLSPFPRMQIPLVCKAAHDTYLRDKREYKVITEVMLPPGRETPITFSFNPAHDIIFLPSVAGGYETSFNDFAVSFPEARHTMRKLAFSNRNLPLGRTMEVVHQIRVFPALEEFWIVYEGHLGQKEEKLVTAQGKDRLYNYAGKVYRLPEDLQRLTEMMRDEPQEDIKAIIERARGAFPEYLHELMERRRDEMWPDWKVPVARVASEREFGERFKEE